MIIWCTFLSMHLLGVGDGKPSPFSKSSRQTIPSAGHGLVLSSAGADRRLDGGLRSVAEVAAVVFQSEKWEGERSLASEWTITGDTKNYVKLAFSI